MRKGNLTKRGNDCQSAMSEMQGYVLENCRWVRREFNAVFPSSLLCPALQSVSEFCARPVWNINPCHIGWLQKGVKGGNNRDGKKYKRLEVSNSGRPMEMGHEFNNIRHWSYFCLWLWLTGWLSVCFDGAKVTSEFSARINDFFQRSSKWWEVLRSDLPTPIV